MKVGMLLAPFVLMLAIGGSTYGQPLAGPDDEDWSKSPEAYFLTSEEKGEWKALRSTTSRLGFIERYWLKRDPSQGTAANEFRDLVANRIRTADARYRIEKTPGSRTAQGFVFIVFGTPARVQERRAAAPAPPRQPSSTSSGAATGSAALYPPAGLIEGTEKVYTWLYEPDRTPRVLEALGVPTLSVSIVVEPQRHRDELQQPGLVNEYRERLARRTIVNPDLVPAASAPVSAAVAAAPPPSAMLPLSREARALVEKAPPQGTLEDEKRPVFGSAILWGDRDAPETLAWVFLPGKDAEGEKMTFHALVKPQEGGPEVLADSEEVASSTTLPTAQPGRVVMRRLALPPGSYSASLAVTGEKNRPVASVTLPLRIPALGKDLAVSSLLLSAGIAPVEGGGDAFTFGTVEVLPRADAEFSRSESLWYFVQLANVDDAEKITQELQLRRGAETIASQPAAPAKLQELAPGRYAFGYEIPLTGLKPGSYMLYVTVRDGSGHSVVRRSDFRVVDRPAKVSSR